jgi:ABC-type sugar transport system substrate-binding protein
MIFGVDDESAIGARHAYEQLQIPLDNVCICSFGFSGQQAYDWLNNGIYHIVCAMFPEYQARMLVHAAIYAYNRRQLPHHLVGPCTALTADELPRYYTRTAEGVQLHVDAVKAISTDGESLV